MLGLPREPSQQCWQSRRRAELGEPSSLQHLPAARLVRGGGCRCEGRAQVVDCPSEPASASGCIHLGSWDGSGVLSLPAVQVALAARHSPSSHVCRPWGKSWGQMLILWAWCHQPCAHISPGLRWMPMAVLVAGLPGGRGTPCAEEGKGQWHHTAVPMSLPH